MNGWTADLSDGSIHEEIWRPEEMSPWRRLMEYCQKNRCYITDLRMTVGNKTVVCPSNAPGYWQSNAMRGVQGIPCDEELHIWRGIGWVEQDTVKIVWGAIDPKTHQVAFWKEDRPVAGQGAVIRP